MLQDDENALINLIRNYSAREVLFALQKIYGIEADNLSDMGFKEKAAAFAEISDSLDALYGVCDFEF